jgi:hypothetical protein
MRGPFVRRSRIIGVLRPQMLAGKAVMNAHVR